MHSWTCGNGVRAFAGHRIGEDGGRSDRVDVENVHGTGSRGTGPRDTPQVPHVQGGRVGPGRVVGCRLND